MSIKNSRIFLALASGGLLTCSFPKVGLDWSAWFALVPLLIAVEGSGAKQALFLGFIAGLVHYLTLLHWLVETMHAYGHLPVFLSVGLLGLLAAYLALYTAFFAAGAARFYSRPGIYWLLVPALWVALEYGRTYMLSGFPWALLGYSQYKQIHWIQIADLAGVYSVSFLVAMVNGFVAQTGMTFLHKLKGDADWKVGGLLVPAAFTAVFLAAAWGYGWQRMRYFDERVARAGKFSVTVVQGNVDQNLKWDREHQQKTIEKYLNLSATAGKSPLLIVWPETAAPFYFMSPYDRVMTQKVQAGVRRSGTWFLIGSPAYERTPEEIRYYNSAYLLNPDCDSVGRYDKVHLVPYGEYVPLKAWFPFLGKIVAEVGDFEGGIKGRTLKWEKGPLGVQICFEIIFPELSRAMAKNGAVLLVNMTNDAWFGRTGAPYQHFSTAVFRAVENRRWLVRAANTGISGFVAPTGRIAAATGLYEAAAETGEVALIAEQTSYTRWGDWFAVFCAVAVLLFGVVGYKKDNKMGGERPHRGNAADGADPGNTTRTM